jgi:UDP-N-acetyl-D-glucosamine dehydrogenase
MEFHDPYVEEVAISGTTLHRTVLTNRAIGRADLVALLTPHAAYDLEWVAEHSSVVFDARRAWASLEPGVVRL